MPHFLQDVQKGLPAVAGKENPEAYPLGYVEEFSDPRTPLDAFFNILLHVVASAADTHYEEWASHHESD